VAISATIVALTAVTSTAVVATLKDADTLSTVALALAVIAFVVQIIVFIVQAATSNQQEKHAQNIYGDTLRALAAIEEKAEGTRATVSMINEKVLDIALGKTIPQAASAGLSLDSPEFAQMLSDRIRSLRADSRTLVTATASSRDANPPVDASELSHGRPLDETMLKFPGLDRMPELIDMLNELEEINIQELTQLGEDQLKFGHPAVDTAGLNVFLDPKPLYERGWIRKTRASWSADPIYSLTENGKDAARILVAEEAIPKQFEHDIRALRRNIRRSPGFDIPVGE
jgi:hypothetical protein